MKSTHTRELVLLFVLAIIWSSSFMFIKIAVSTLTPLTLTFARIALGAIVLAAYSFYRGDKLPRDRETWLAACVVGLLGNVLAIISGVTHVPITSKDNLGGFKL